MSLRPRYSLLTLLILTALFAGGVKLWYGPHHVVERRISGRELEYTYTRDWNGEKILHGPCIMRYFQNNDLQFLFVTYFRQGFNLECHFELYLSDSQSFPAVEPNEFDVLPMQPEERLDFSNVVKKERLQKKEAGPKLHWNELLNVPYEREGFVAGNRFSLKDLELIYEKP